MNEDHTFRAAQIVGFLILVPIALFYRIRSQATREKLDRRQEGVFIMVTGLAPILWTACEWMRHGEY